MGRRQKEFPSFVSGTVQPVSQGDVRQIHEEVGPWRNSRLRTQAWLTCTLLTNGLGVVKERHFFSVWNPSVPRELRAAMWPLREFSSLGARERWQPGREAVFSGRNEGEEPW
jgi:hypothetical protein